MKTKIGFTWMSVAAMLVMMAFITGSCNKDSDPPPYYVKALIDGIELNNTGYAVAEFTNIVTTGHQACTIEGKGASYETNNLLTLVVVDIDPITTKEYTSVMVAGAIQAKINYTDKNGAEFSSIFSSAPDAVITVTGITATEVTGTFSGTLNSSSSSRVVSVTNGLFKVQIL